MMLFAGLPLPSKAILLPSTESFSQPLLQIWTGFKLKVSRTFNRRGGKDSNPTNLLNSELIKSGARLIARFAIVLRTVWLPCDNYGNVMIIPDNCCWWLFIIVGWNFNFYEVQDRSKYVIRAFEHFKSLINILGVWIGVWIGIERIVLKDWIRMNLQMRERDLIKII